MAYKQNFGPSRTSGYNKTKQVAGQSSLFRLGSSPLNHDMDFGHEHDGENDRYSRQVPVKPGTKKQNRKSRNKLAAQLTNAANTRDADGDALNTQGYMRGGRGGKLKIGGRNLLEVKTGTRGGGEGSVDAFTSKQYSNVKEKDVRKQLKKTGSVNIVDGKVSSGTSQTKKAYGSVKRDVAKQEKDKAFQTRKTEAKNARATKLATLKATRENKAKVFEAKKTEAKTARTAKIQAVQNKRNAAAADLAKRKKERNANKK